MAKKVAKMVRSTPLKRSAGCISGVSDYSRCIPVSGIIIAVLLIFFCGAVSAETAVNDVVLSVSPGIAGEAQVWNVSFHINQGLVNETNGFFITFDQSFVVDDPFDPECITVWSNQGSAQPHRVIIIHNPNESYPLYQPGTTTVKFNNPMDIPFNSDVLISFSCGVHTDCPINCSGYHVWANTDVETYPVESNYVYIRIPVTAGAGDNGMIQSPDGNFSPPDHTQVFDCGSEPLYLITPDSSYKIDDVTVDDVSVVDDPNYTHFPDGHAEYIFDPLHCDHTIYGTFEFEIQPPELIKTTSNSIVTPGTTYFYTIGYYNPNPVNLTNASITDTIPSNLLFVNATGDWHIEDDNILWTLGTLAPNESGSVIMTVMVNGSAPAGTFLNCAELETDQSGPVEDCTDVTVIIPPVITKTAPAGVVAPAGTYTYSITYQNPNTVSLTGASITDAIPADLVFVNATGDWSFVNDTITWSLGTLTPNETGTVTMTVHVGYLVPPGTVITNCAELGTDPFEPVSNCTDVRVLFIPVINKTSPAEMVAPGETFTYSIVYENPNSVSLTGVILTDYIESNLVFVNATGDWSFDDDVVIWSLGTLAPNETGTVTLTVSVKTDVLPGTLILNCAELETDQFEERIFDCTDVTVAVPPLLEKTAPSGIVTPGETFTYSIAYENPDTINLTNASITDTIPADLIFVDAPGGFIENGTVIWPLGTLAPGETGIVNLTVSVKTGVSPGTVITNCAELETDQFEEPVFDCTDVTVVVPPIIIKSASSGVVTPGETFTYSIAYENPDTVNLTGAYINDTIPANLTFVNAPGGSFENGTVKWPLGTLAPDETGTVTLTVSVHNDVAPGTVITNCASIYTDQFEPIENCTNVTVNGCITTVGLSKVSSRYEVAPGESFIYTINYNTSCGCGPITGVVVSDHLPDEVTFVSATHSGVYDGNNVTWLLGTIGACEEGELNIVVRVPLIAVDPKVTNIVTLFYDQGQPLTATADTIIDPSRIPDPRNVLVYPPVPKFVAIPKSGAAPLYVRFIDFSSGKPTSWLWDFGDNATSWLKNPTHTYTSPGRYTVTLTATNDWGAGTTIHNNEIMVNIPIVVTETHETGSQTGNETPQSTVTNYTSPYDRFIRTGKSPFSSLFG